MKIQYLSAFTLPLLLTGCAWLAPDYKRADLDMPEKWADEQAGDKAVDMKEWWKEYDDPVLEKLIEEALANNGDLALASARLRQSRAQYDYAFANQFPLLSVNGTADRVGLPSAVSDKPANLSFIGGLLTYELDLWGRQASASEATKAALIGTKYNQDALKLSVSAATAQLYFEILALDADIKITQDTIRSRDESYGIVKKQFDREAVNGLVLKQSEAEMEGTRAKLSQLVEQRDKAESALAVLLGRSPKDIIQGNIERGSSIDELPVSPVTPDILPSKILERRPDIASAEQALIASNFNIGIARAAYFPQISLSALLGISSIDVHNIYQSTMRTWMLGASMAGPVIDFGRTSSGVDLAKAENQELLASYKNTVRTAFKEVKDALSAQTNSQGEEESIVKEEAALKEALRLANLRYSSGYSSYIEVLDAERNLYNAQIGLVAAKLGRLNASVNMYKALGGGWVGERPDVIMKAEAMLRQSDSETKPPVDSEPLQLTKANE